MVDILRRLIDAARHHMGTVQLATSTVDCGRRMQRKPRWQVEVSTGCAMRAAGRYRRQ
jgi:hypothetical protein